MQAANVKEIKTNVETVRADYGVRTDRKRVELSCERGAGKGRVSPSHHMISICFTSLRNPACRCEHINCRLFTWRCTWQVTG